MENTFTNKFTSFFFPIIFIGFLWFVPINAFASVFYVDPDWGGTASGSASQPWRSLDAAAWAVVNNALSSGDVTVYFSARSAASDTNQISYSGLNIARTNTSSYRLTIDGMSRYNSNDVSPSWLFYSGMGKFEIRYGYAIQVYNPGTNQDYITIRGFKAIGGYNAYGGQALNYWGGSHVVIENNELTHDPSVTHGATLQFGNNLVSSDVTIRNNIIHDTAGEAIYVGSYYAYETPVYLTGVLIENNTIYNAGKYGGQGDCIDLKAGLANVIVRNNICHDSEIGSNVNGIVGISSFTAEENAIYNQPLNGIAGTAGITLRDNIIFGNERGVYISDTATIGYSGGTITNNTIYNNSGTGIIIGVNGGGINNLQVKNNIIMQNGTGIGGWGSAGYSITNNDIYANTTNYAGPFSSNQTLPGLNISIDPQFKNATNPPGADGIFFTADDGFVPQNMNVCTGGTNGTFIGALPCALSPDATPPSPPAGLTVI